VTRVLTILGRLIIGVGLAVVMFLAVAAALKGRP